MRCNGYDLSVYASNYFMCETVIDITRSHQHQMCPQSYQKRNKYKRADLISRLTQNRFRKAQQIYIKNTHKL